MQTQHQRAARCSTHTVEFARAAAVFATASAFFVAYAWNNERRRSGSTIIAQYKVLQTSGADGWEWRRPIRPVHRVTAAVDLAAADRPRAADSWRMCRQPLDAAIGGWQLHARPRASTRAGRCSSPPAIVVDGDPRVEQSDPRSWFDTSKFAAAGLVHAAQQPVATATGLNGPSVVPDRHDADQDVHVDVEVSRSRRASRPTTRSMRSCGTIRK